MHHHTKFHDLSLKAPSAIGTLISSFAKFHEERLSCSGNIVWTNIPWGFDAPLLYQIWLQKYNNSRDIEETINFWGFTLHWDLDLEGRNPTFSHYRKKHTKKRTCTHARTRTHTHWLLRGQGLNYVLKVFLEKMSFEGGSKGRRWIRVAERFR